MKRQSIGKKIFALMGPILVSISISCTDELSSKSLDEGAPGGENPILAPVETFPGTGPASPEIITPPEPPQVDSGPAQEPIEDAPDETPKNEIIAAPAVVPPSEGDTNAGNGGGTSTPSETVEVSDGDEDRVPSSETEETPYVFDPSTKTCKNEEGLTGLNSGSVLSCSDQTGKKISDGDFAGSDLSGIDLSGSSIEDTNLDGANLAGADVTDVKLDNVKIDGVNSDEADFENSVISNSEINDFETIDKLVENGLEIGLNNKLPAVVAEVEAVIKDETSIDSKDALKIDEYIDVRDLASELLDNLEKEDLIAEAKRLKEEIKKRQEEIENNRAPIKSARVVIKEIKDEKKIKQGDVKGIKNQVIATKKDLKKLLQQKKDLSAELRDLKKKYKVTNSTKEKDRIKDQIKKADSARKKVVLAIKEFRTDRNRTIASIKQTQKEIDKMLDRVSDQRDQLKVIKKDNQENRAAILAAVKRYKEIRKKLKV